jgi:hypothetical protein
MDKMIFQFICVGFCEDIHAKHEEPVKATELKADPLIIDG